MFKNLIDQSQKFQPLLPFKRHIIIKLSKIKDQENFFKRSKKHPTILTYKGNSLKTIETIVSYRAGERNDIFKVLEEKNVPAKDTWT